MQSILQSYILTAVLAGGLTIVAIVAAYQYVTTHTVDPTILGLWGTLISLLNAQAHLTTTAKVTSLEAKINGNGK